MEVKTEKKEEEDEIPQLVVKSVETVKKSNVIKKLVDDWDDDDEKEDFTDKGEKSDSERKNDKVEKEETIRKSVDLDEDQIVADVDDILKETDADKML